MGTAMVMSMMTTTDSMTDSTTRSMTHYAIRIVHVSGGSLVEWFEADTLISALRIAQAQYASDPDITRVYYAGVQAVGQISQR